MQDKVTHYFNTRCSGLTLMSGNMLIVPRSTTTNSVCRSHYKPCETCSLAYLTFSAVESVLLLVK